jgi:hypothetical protein
MVMLRGNKKREKQRRRKLEQERQRRRSLVAARKSLSVGANPMTIRVNPVAFCVDYMLVIIAMFLLVAAVLSTNPLRSPQSIAVIVLAVVFVLRVSRVRAIVYEDRVRFVNLFSSGTARPGARIRSRRNWFGPGAAEVSAIETESGRFIAADAFGGYFSNSERNTDIILFALGHPPVRDHQSERWEREMADYDYSNEREAE